MIDRPSGRPAASPSYVELHCHSAFSFLDGASLPEDLAAAAHSLGYRALALTDRNGMYGSMTFAQSAKPLDLQAITGAEVTLTVVASGNEHYNPREQHRLHDVLVAIRHRTTLDGSHRVRRPNSEFYLRPPEEMAALFPDCPAAVANTLAIAERCAAFDLTRDLGYTFPDFRGADLAPAPQALAELCRARLGERYAVGSTHRA